MAIRILIAEDDEMQGAALRSVLQRRGYNVENVTDGFEAVRRMRADSFDLALLDYQMPEFTGLATAQLLLELLGVDGCPPLIAITAQAPELTEREKRSQARVFDAIVSKRHGLQALLAAVDTITAAATDEKAAARAKRHKTAANENETAGSDSARPSPDAGTRYPVGAWRQGDGQLQALSLAAFRLALGPDWPRVGLGAMQKAESIVKRRLAEGDVMSRCGDHGFVVWFMSSDGAANQAVMEAAGREIRLRFLVDFGDDVARNASITLRQTVA